MLKGWNYWTHITNLLNLVENKLNYKKNYLYDPFSLPYNQSLLSSTQDSIESLATPQEADLDDEHIRILLASPRYLLEREASAERSQIYPSEREGLMSSSSQSLNFFGTRKAMAWLSQQKSLDKKIFQKESNLLIF